MQKPCRFFVLLSIFLAIAGCIRANLINKQTRDSRAASRSHDDRLYDTGEEKGEDGNTRGTTPSIVDASRRSLASRRVAFLTSPTITSRIVHQRRKRDAAYDGEAAARFVSYGASRENEDSSREKRILYPWRFDGHVTKKRGKHRRPCKKLHGCPRSDRRNKNKHNHRKRNRNVNKKWEMMNPLEHRKWFQQQSHGNGNIETRVLVGNRPLALFRKELAAAAAANAADAIAARKLVDRFLDIGAKDIDDTISDKKSGRIRGTSAKHSSSIRPSKRKNINVGKEIGKKKKKNSSRSRDRHANREREKYGAILKLGIFEDAKKLEKIDDSSAIEDRPWKFSKNLTNTYESREKESRNETSLDILAKVANEESNETVTMEDQDFVDKSVISSIYMPKDDRVVIHESLISMLSKFIDSRDNSTILRNNGDISESANERGNLPSTSDDENDIDVCRKLIESEKKLEEIFLGPLAHLPACPCQYPSGIINDDEIWDKHQKKNFRWQDVGNKTGGDDAAPEPALKYCIKSLERQKSPDAAIQHCCYDNKKRLLTHGSEAARPIFTSPEISLELHEKIDNLPWKLCTSDLIRLNKVRTPNNDNRCDTNPEDKDQRV